MAIGTGLPLSAILSGVGNENLNNALNQQGRNSFANSTASRPSPNDSIDLSERSLRSLESAQNTFDTIRRGIQTQQRQDAQFTADRLAQIREQIQFVSNSLPQAGPDQEQVILGQLAEIAGGLNGVGNSLGGALNISASRNTTQAQLFNASFSSNFNAVAAAPQGQFSVAEELNVDFSFLQVSSTQETIEISRTEEGVSIERTVEQTNLVVAELNVEQSQTGVVQRRGSNFEDLVSQFRDTLKEFSDLIGSFQEQFGQEKIPKPFIDLIKGIVSSDLEGALKESPLLVDQEA